MSKVLFSAVRNEAPFLVEWIAYHKVIGFDRFVILSNESTDGTDELLSALALAGEIEHHLHRPEGISAQANAALLAERKKLLGEGDWVIWLDADEFLVVNVGSGSLDNLIDAVGDHLGVLIPWRLFGDGGNNVYPGRFVSSSFTRCSRWRFKFNREIKTLFRMGTGVAGLSMVCIQRPRIIPESGVGVEDFITATGAGLQASSVNQRWVAGEDLVDANWLSEQEHGYRLAQINHYTVRTPEHFLLKRLRGRGWEMNRGGSRNNRHTSKYYWKMNRNEAENKSILKHEAGVTAEMARLRALPGVVEAEERALAIVGDQIAKLPKDELRKLLEPRNASDTSRITRPQGAPRGIVRAHMATFPARAGIFRRVVDAILPQVDCMVIVFNEMDEVPADIAANDRIEAITTDRDTKGLGRFFMPPEPDDIVFLVDDDILYPADYVSQSIERATEIGWDGNVFGYGGMNHRGDGQQGTGWQATGISQGLPSARGVRMLGTGSVVARGDAVPSLAAMAPYYGHADVGFALLNLRAGRKAWMLPRAERWLRDGMSPELEASSLSGTLRAKPTLPVVAGIGEIIAAPLDHIGMAPGTRRKTAQEVT